MLHFPEPRKKSWEEHIIALSFVRCRFFFRDISIGHICFLDLGGGACRVMCAKKESKKRKKEKIQTWFLFSSQIQFSYFRTHSNASVPSYTFTTYLYAYVRAHTHTHACMQTCIHNSFIHTYIRTYDTYIHISMHAKNTHARTHNTQNTQDTQNTYNTSTMKHAKFAYIQYLQHMLTYIHTIGRGRLSTHRYIHTHDSYIHTKHMVTYIHTIVTYIQNT
jgi:hypothetical protein